jgi:hypothetical protein
MIAKPVYPYLCRDVDRHGRTRWRLRMPGRKTVTIKGQFGQKSLLPATELRSRATRLNEIDSQASTGPLIGWSVSI